MHAVLWIASFMLLPLCGAGYISWALFNRLDPVEGMIWTGTLLVILLAVYYYLVVLGRRQRAGVLAKCPWCKIPYTQHLTPEWECLFRQQSSAVNATTNATSSDTNHAVNQDDKESTRAVVNTTSQLSTVEKEEQEDRSWEEVERSVGSSPPFSLCDDVDSTGTKLRRSARLRAKRKSPGKSTEHQ